MLDTMIAEFEAECDRKNAEKLFRIHHDGDFFSVRYVSAWHAVMLKHPNVTFWAYTRSFHLVKLLADIPNLTLYLSVDKDNLGSAIETYSANPWVKLVYWVARLMMLRRCLTLWVSRARVARN